MRVQVIANTVDRPNESMVVWEGDITTIPREGDTVFVFEGWGGRRAQRVYWCLESKVVEIHIDDRTGEYAKEAKRRLSA